MNEKSEIHLAGILLSALDVIEVKYRAGNKKHNSDLTDMSKEDLLDNAIEEATDQLVYLLTLKQKSV